MGWMVSYERLPSIFVFSSVQFQLNLKNRTTAFLSFDKRSLFAFIQHFVLIAIAS